MNETKRCPVCHLPPEVAVEDNQTILSCPRHGHMAIGATLPQAIEHWNRYISFVAQAA